MAIPKPRKLLIVLLVFIGGSVIYWLLPLPGQIVLVREGWQQEQTWPQVRLDVGEGRPGSEVTAIIADPVPWPHVKLFVAGREATLQGYERAGPGGAWQWTYTFPAPEVARYELSFFHDCDGGCQSWTTVTVGGSAAEERQEPLQPTALGVVFANPARNWHGRQAWAVDLTYATLADDPYWGIDDTAARVQAAAAAGLLVLLRVDYAQGQSLPPAGDTLALDFYLGYLRRLARDARFDGVYGYIIGSGYNTAGGNSLAAERPVTPAWYARLFNGYETEPGRGDNVVAVVRAAQPAARVLVGPVTPWSNDQDGQRAYAVDVPWLNYMNTLVAALDEAAAVRAEAGLPLRGPDGFAVQAPGRPELVVGDPANEPREDLPVAAQEGAQAGFRIYREWQAIVNAYPYTAGLPLYISATNTFHPAAGVLPAENYPPGWLTTALEVVSEEPQLVALIWFMDYFPHDEQWAFFSLTARRGQLVEAAAEFERLLATGAP